jgi:hypothetical protein
LRPKYASSVKTMFFILKSYLSPMYHAAAK